MMISHSKKFIFVHNYKVAGTSIRDSLDKYNNRSFISSSFADKIAFVRGRYPRIFSSQFEGHINASGLKRKLPKIIFDTYYKFGFVRNPWDWQVSLFTYMLQDKTHHQHQLTKSMANFDAYIEWRINEDLHLQKDFFYEEDTCLVDFIGKMENLSNDFNVVLNKIGIQSSLPHLKKSRPNDNFKEYYSQKSIDLIYEAFIKDIKLFGYSKPEL